MSTPQPWTLYAATLPGYPDEHEKWMHGQFLAAGVAIAGIDVGESYGSPPGRELFTALYEELTKMRGFAGKSCLLGRSRGGLWVTSWACDHTDQVGGSPKSTPCSISATIHASPRPPGQRP
jgi:hypothetical protein